MAEKYTKWVACFGNALSVVSQKECTYSKDLTLRYPILMCFSGRSLRLHFSNLSGREPVELNEVLVARSTDMGVTDEATNRPVTFSGRPSGTILPGEDLISDPVDFDITAGETLSVSIYLKNYTDMTSAVQLNTPFRHGFYAYGHFTETSSLPAALTGETGWYYFLETVDILTEERNHALITYGDSITAKSWPDYLEQRVKALGITNVSVIRRAVSGSRILREYNCIAYTPYGRSGEHRFRREIETAGADAVIILHGINDIIHPEGSETNIFRPWSDLPTAEELMEGLKNIYVLPAREKGLKVYAATLTPIDGWRTYLPLREAVRTPFNDLIRTSGLFDGVADFDLALRDPEKPLSLLPLYDSGDHLHPSEEGGKALAFAIPEEWLK